MKQTTKPNTKQSHLLKRDLARNVAALPLPTPPAGAWGEGRRSAEPNFEIQNLKAETNSKTEVQKPTNIEHRTSNFELEKIGRDGSTMMGAMVDLQFPQFTGIAIRRDEPFNFSQGTNQTILTLTTDYQLPNV